MTKKNKFKKIFLLFCLLLAPPVFSKNRVVNLVIGYKTVYFAGQPVKAIAVNNHIPAPTLHFKQGDHVTINVHNELDQDTAIHWHGIILPWQMDGVVGVSQRGIPPGGVFHYRFTLNQSGTYWYHAHAGLQEQQGLYGAILIDPLKQPNYRYTKEYAIVLSDWSNTNPDKILANLKKEGNYYSPDFPLQPSLIKFLRDYQKSSPEEKKQLVDDYKTMQQMRMSIYDFSDVAYDAFLLNGHSNSIPWTAPVKVGDVVRLRFIGAGASTIFHVKIQNAIMQMVQVDGNDVRPYSIKNFTIAPGETFDVLVKIRNKSPYIIYAESADTVAAAYGALITQQNQAVHYKHVAPFPEPLPITREMMTLDESRPQGASMPMKHAEKPPAMDHASSHATRMNSKYDNVIAATKTNDPNKPIAAVINMELFGYMDRYIWFINGVPENRAHPVILEQGKRYRFVFSNSSMMHHPMHIHGHWFILREGHGAYDPLLHTIDVPPGAVMIADVDTDASGQWILHCHLLYHMAAGMARTIQYSTLLEVVNGERKPQNVTEQTTYANRPIVRVDEALPINDTLVEHPMPHSENVWYATFLDLSVNPVSNDGQMTFKGLYGSDYNKLELFTNDAEIDNGVVENADMDIFYWHVISQFWAIKGGVNYFNRPAQTPYWQPGLGIEGLMPYFIDVDFRTYYYNDSTKFDLELTRASQITNNFFIHLGIRGIVATNTVTQAEIGGGLNQMRYTVRPYYRLAPGLDVFAEYEHDQNYGNFKTLQAQEGEAASQNTLTFGVAMLF